jgi:hypothetical protein
MTEGIEKKCESKKWLRMVSSISVESLGSLFRKLFGYMECISIERELVAQMVPPSLPPFLLLV